MRERLGDGISDREIARRWGMEWKSFAALKHGQRQVPRIDELERLAAVLGVSATDVFAAASSAPRSAARAPAPTPRDALRLTVDRVPDALLTIDLDGRIHDFNRALVLLTGRSASELRGRPLVELIAVDSASRAVACIAGAIEAGQPGRAEAVLLAATSHLRLVTLQATPVLRSDGVVLGAQVVARDVAAERPLAGDRDEERRFLQTLFDRIPAACILFDGDGTILAANPLVEGVCAAGAAEIIGKKLADVFGDVDPDGCPVTRTLRSRRVEQQVSWMTNRRGQAVYVHRTAGPLSDA
ncbi:MAG TPA: PAS domain-containing protein, partial [Polyangia bacterium]